MQEINLPRLSIPAKSWVALSNLKSTSGSCIRGRIVFDSPQPKCPLLLSLLVLLDQQLASMAFPSIGFEIIGA